MLSRLRIQNFLLIEHLDLDLRAGFTVITGETGAGKSVLIGALSLLMGERADAKWLPKQGKCTLEITIKNFPESVSNWLNNNDFDKAPELIIHRELLAGGRGRCFINDTPAQVAQLRELGAHLIDMHAQMEQRELNQPLYRNRLMDAFAGLEGEMTQYNRAFRYYKELSLKLDEARARLHKISSDNDYRRFLLSEFDALSLNLERDADLDEALKRIENSGRISETLGYATQIIGANGDNLLHRLSELHRRFAEIGNWGKSYFELAQRLKALEIELQDIHFEVQNLSDSDIPDPREAEALRTRVNSINALLFKHKASNIENLLQVWDTLLKEADYSEKVAEEVSDLENELTKSKQKLTEAAASLSRGRLKAAPILSKEIKQLLVDLGMPHARFEVVPESLEDFTQCGAEVMQFLFSANKGIAPVALDKVASGGEYSRIVLAIKSLTHSAQHAGTVIFDEIDTGVSGEIADKMARAMKQLSKNTQVISITHLPQVAARGDEHIKVSKQHLKNKTLTLIQKLNRDERILELAGMLSGNVLTDAARENAQFLLNN
jgi:DNA repair protein RecN (Recombination protein N)